jgi:hypothetical protein
MLTYRLGTLAGFAAILMMMQGSALADITVAGNTNGSSFYSGGTNLGATVFTSSDFASGSVTYTAGSFGPESSNKTLVLGSLSLSCLLDLCDSNYNPYTFDLKVTFTQPTGSGQQTFVGDVQGAVVGVFVGALNTVGIDFGSPAKFTSTAGQSFYLTVNDIAAGSIPVNGGSAQLLGNVSLAPEPKSIVLLGTVLAGIALWRRKRSHV